jgi:hypothetical protein
VGLLGFFFLGSVAFDARRQRAITVFAIDDAFWKVVPRVLEDSFLPSQSRQFEVRVRSPGLMAFHFAYYFAILFGIRSIDEFVPESVSYDMDRTAGFPAASSWLHNSLTLFTSFHGNNCMPRSLPRRPLSRRKLRKKTDTALV